MLLYLNFTLTNSSYIHQVAARAQAKPLGVSIPNPFRRWQKCD